MTKNKLIAKHSCKLYDFTIYLNLMTENNFFYGGNINKDYFRSNYFFYFIYIFFIYLLLPCLFFF